MLKNIFLIFWGVLKYPVIAILAVIALFFLLYVFFIVAGLLKGRKIQKGTHKNIKPRNALVRLFIDFPKQMANDFFNLNPDDFKYKGCVIFTGRQGNGKTIAMVEYGLRMKKEYPLSKMITNLGVAGEDSNLNHWKKLIDYKNGSKGVICLIDETQNWFSSTQSKNFPPEMLQVITQNRKNRRIILGTSQNFYLLAKAIRSQCTEVRECRTFFGCLTVVRRKEPILNAEGNVEEWRKLGWYFFVHNDELRDAYDTYKVIAALSDSGFKDNADVLSR